MDGEDPSTAEHLRRVSLAAVYRRLIVLHRELDCTSKQQAYVEARTALAAAAIIIRNLASALYHSLK